MDPETTDGRSERHWGSSDPAADPSHDLVAGVPRMVMEARDRMGADATAEQVAEELKQRGLEVTLADVQAAWDR